MKFASLTVTRNADDWTFDVLEAHYRTLVKYLNFQNAGMVLGKDCGSSSMTNITGYPEAAYELGKNCRDVTAKYMIFGKNKMRGGRK